MTIEKPRQLKPVLRNGVTSYAGELNDTLGNMSVVAILKGRYKRS